MKGQSASGAGQLQTYVLLTIPMDKLGEEQLVNLFERLDKASTAFGMEISAVKT